MFPNPNVLLLPLVIDLFFNRIFVCRTPPQAELPASYSIRIRALLEQHMGISLRKVEQTRSTTQAGTDRDGIWTLSSHTAAKTCDRFMFSLYLASLSGV